MKFTLFWNKAKRKIWVYYRYFLSFIFRTYWAYLYPAFTPSRRVLCPICGWSGAAFFDIDLGNNEVYRNAECPRCHSQHRHRYVYMLLKKYLASRPHLKLNVLHVAPEPVLTSLLKTYPNISYLSVDLESPLAMKKANIEKLNEPSNHFDIILCFHVLEHVTNDRAALRELYRILKPSGVALIDVPINWACSKTYEDTNIKNPADRHLHFGQKDHVRYYGTDFPKKLQAVGFQVTLAQEHNIPKQQWLRLPEHPIYIATKQPFRLRYYVYEDQYNSCL